MSHSITISWTAAPGPVSGYNIRRGSVLGNEAALPLNGSPVAGLTYTDNTVVAGQSYSYSVNSVLSGIESATAIQIESTAVPFGPTPASLLPLAPNALLSFSVLGSSTVTNVTSTATTANGDVGVYPGTSITNFGAPAAIGGVFHSNDYVSAAAQTSAQAAFTAGNALPGGTTILGDIGGTVMFPGVYKNASSVGITGTLVLDAQGNPNACWIFQIGSTLTTATTNSNVVLMGGAQAQNVFWLIGSSATLGTYTNFAGVLIAQASVTVGTGVRDDGVVVALTGAVTMDTNEFYLSGLLPSLPNTPPAPPAAPSALIIDSEV
jgi:hypothetical protein